MECYKCKKEFQEKDIHLSHDVPCYLFFIEEIKRQKRKHYADKYNRRYLCEKCHKEYEKSLRDHFILEAKKFSYKYFGDNNDKN